MLERENEHSIFLVWSQATETAAKKEWHRWGKHLPGGRKQGSCFWVHLGKEGRCSGDGVTACLLSALPQLFLQLAALPSACTRSCPRQVPDALSISTQPEGLSKLSPSVRSTGEPGDGTATTSAQDSASCSITTRGDASSNTGDCSCSPAQPKLTGLCKAFGVTFLASIKDLHSRGQFLNKDPVQSEKKAEFCVEAGESMQLLLHTNKPTVLYVPKDLRQNLWSTVINRAWKSGLGFNFIHDVSSAFPFFSCRLKS